MGKSSVVLLISGKRFPPFPLFIQYSIRSTFHSNHAKNFFQWHPERKGRSHTLTMCRRHDTKDYIKVSRKNRSV